MDDHRCTARDGSRRTRSRRLAMPMVGLTIASLISAQAHAADTVPAAGGLNPGGNSAHAIAERFARAAAGAGTANASSTAETAKAKPEAATAAADAALDAALRRATEARRKVEATARKAAEQRRIDEADMLARARGEAEAREAEARLAEVESRAADANLRAAEAEAVRIAAEADRAQQAADAAAAATEQNRAQDAERRAEDMRKAQQAEREAETLRIVEKLRAARAAKAAEVEQLEASIKARARSAEPPIDGRSSETTARSTAALPMPPVATSDVATAARPSIGSPDPIEAALEQVSPGLPSPIASAEPQPSAVPASRATVILVLATGGRGLGRNGTTTADPVLCLGGTCYVGQGSAKPSSAMPRHVALGPGNTLGQRAGACARSLVCIYRNVEIASGSAEFQPVDLRLLRHDRRDVAVGRVDGSCNATSGRLICGKPVTSTTWTAWIVPEPVATAVGAEMLDAAASAKLDVRTAAAR